MGLSRMTAWLIASNRVRVFEIGRRAECWLMRGDEPRRLLLSCPVQDRAELDRIIGDLQSERSEILEADFQAMKK